MTGQPYDKQWFCTYFDVQIKKDIFARFKRNKFTRTLYIFRFNIPKGNRWNEPGYGWGKWEKI